MSQKRLMLPILLLLTAGGLTTRLAYLPLIRDNESFREKRDLNRRLISRLEEKSVPSEEIPLIRRNRIIGLYNAFDQGSDLYAFGSELKADLLDRGLSITRYQELQSEEGRFLEYHMEGGIKDFLSFLSDQERGGFREISALTISSGTYPARMTLRIAPARIPDGVARPPGESGQADPLRMETDGPVDVSGIFYRPPPGNDTPSRTAADSEPKAGALRNALTYIGRVSTAERGPVFCFKEADSGRLIRVNARGETDSGDWRLLKQSDGLFLLSHGNDIYEVNHD